ncbi:MAG: TolC family protein [Acidobacteria bacterium]|nr:TolC family protein [Acidobacteriota bacterium]
MPRIIHSLVLLIFFLRALPAQDAAAITLEEAVRIAMDRHQDVGKALANADALRGRIREVRAMAMPEVNIVSNAQRYRDPSFLNAAGLDKFPPELLQALTPFAVNLFDYSITVKQPLYTQGKIGTALKIAKVEAEGTATEVERARQDVAIATVKAFYGLLWSEHNRNLIAETQRQKQLHAEMARTRFRNGVATKVDVMRSEVAVANGAPDLLRAESLIRQSRAQMNFFLGRPLDFATKLAGGFQEEVWRQQSLAEIETEALERRPEIQRLRLAERSAAVQLELAKAESRMRLDLASSYGIAARLPENLVNGKFVRWNTALNFTFPVFDGFKRDGLVWQASAAMRAARLEREKSEQQVRLAIQQGMDELHAAWETVAAARANVQEAETVLSMTQKNYEAGAATTLDVTDAQTAVSVARTNLLRGLYDYSVARANLRWAAGRTPWE